MNNNNEYILEKMNKYVLKKNNKYEDEIYLVWEDKKSKEKIIEKLEGKEDKSIMNKVLKKLTPKEIENGVYIYTDLKKIKENFELEKQEFEKKKKKVNREKSKKILPKIILTTALVVSIATGAYKIHNNTENQNKEEQSITTIQPTITEKPNISVDYNSENGLHIKDTHEEVPQTVDFTETEPNIFYYEYDTPSDKGAYENASQYMNLFEKYGKIYGIDAKLLCAIAAQESSGIHKSYSQNGHATGLMQIENIWADGEFKVFNFEKNDYETIKVNYDNIGNLEYNVKIGAAIYKWTFDYCKKNFPDISDQEIVAFCTQCYNYGAGFIRQAIENAKKLPNGTWMDGREYIKAGDKKYFEHVLSRISNNETIIIYENNGDKIETVLVNTCLEKTSSRAH